MLERFLAEHQALKVSTVGDARRLALFLAIRCSERHLQLEAVIHEAGGNIPQPDDERQPDGIAKEAYDWAIWCLEKLNWGKRALDCAFQAYLCGLFRAHILSDSDDTSLSV